MDKIIVKGVNYRHTPLAIREKLVFDTETEQAFLTELTKHEAVKEAVLLSTCNRTELYINTDRFDFQPEFLESSLCAHSGLDPTKMKKYFYEYQNQAAAAHLFKVASGIDSMVMGEDQILGQLREAHARALEQGNSKSVLNTLFRHAVTTAKRIKTQTKIKENSVSLGALVARLAEQEFGESLEHKTALILGSGEIGTLVFKNLLYHRIGKVYITSRDHDRSQFLHMRGFKAELVNFSDRYRYIPEADLIVSATASPHYTILAEKIKKITVLPSKQIFVDLSVPRDIDSGIKTLDHVSYYHLDDLQHLSSQNQQYQLLEKEIAEKIVQEGIKNFKYWYEFRKHLPFIDQLKQEMLAKLEQELQVVMAEIGTLSEAEQALLLENHQRIFKAMLHKMIYMIKTFHVQQS